jgi:hypothetical protein
LSALSFALHWKGARSESLHPHHSCLVPCRNNRDLWNPQSTGDLPWNYGSLCRDLLRRRNPSRLKQLEFYSRLPAFSRQSLHKTSATREAGRSNQIKSKQIKL